MLWPGDSLKPQSPRVDSASPHVRLFFSLRQNTERRYYFLFPRAGRASIGLFPLSRNIYRLDPPMCAAIGSNRQQAVERRPLESGHRSPLFIHF